MTVVLKLARELRERDEAEFRHGIELTDILSVVVAQLIKKNRLGKTDVLKALLTSLVSYVQFLAPEDEWEHVGDTLAHELRARLTPRQVN